MMQTQVESRSAAPVLLSYRPWRGEFGGPARGIWAIARTALFMLFRRKLFWALYSLCAMIFLFYFYGQYLQIWIASQLGEDTIRLGSGLITFEVKPDTITEFLK